MSLTAIYANLSCSSLAASTPWFETLFGRKPDATPMPGLAEWHEGETGGFQLYENKDNAGNGTVTLIVDDVRGDSERLENSGLKIGEIEPADYTTIMRMKDPDGNLIVLAQPGRA